VLTAGYLKVFKPPQKTKYQPKEEQNGSLIANLGGPENSGFRTWAREFMGTLKSIKALADSDQFTKWNAACRSLRRIRRQALSN
jgi:hypothetical protein